MEQQKTLNVLNDDKLIKLIYWKTNNSKFVRRKWTIVNDNSKSNYDAANEITYNTEILIFVITTMVTF